MGIPTSSGIINITISGAMGSSETFTSVYNYLTSLSASNFGITLVANNSGSNAKGFDYWNTPNYVGNNAWALFKWANANTPFYFLMQYATSSIGSAGTPGYPASFGMNGDANWDNNGGTAFSVAMRVDGSSPWNGTTNANGQDSKGSPVWETGSNADLYVWPRSNSYSGSHATLRHRMHMFMSHYYLNTGGKFRLHFIANNENFVFIFSDPSVGGRQFPTWFGRFDQFSSSYGIETTFSHSCPYAMLCRGNNNTDPTWNWRTAYVYGSTTHQTEYEGGVAHPSPLRGVVGASLDTLWMMWYSGFHPATIRPDNHYEALPPMILMNEDTPISHSRGLLGQTTDFVRFVYGMNLGDLSADKLWTVVSANTSVSSSKLLFPWDGVTIPDFASTQGARTGTIY